MIQTPNDNISQTSNAVIDDRYQVLQELGKGAVGVVYSVIDLTTPKAKPVALKLLYPHLLTDASVFARFRQEVRLSRSLLHPCIIQTYEFNHSSADCCYFTMEHVHGKTLAEITEQSERNRLSFELITYLGWQILSALAYSHRNGVIHRDIKPQNILVTDDYRVKLSDFGLACLVEDEGGTTKTGASLGTPYYMSPEQFRGEKVNAQSDIYSFGVLLFELISGERPFKAEVFYQLAIEHLTLPLPNVKALRDDVPSWLIEVVNNCCKKSAPSRPESAYRVLEKFSRNISEDNRPKISLLLRESAIKSLPGRIKATAIALFGAVIFLFASISALALVSRYETSTQVFMGSSIIKAEIYSGLNLGYLRSLFGIRVSARDAKDIQRLISLTAGDKFIRQDVSILARSVPAAMYPSSQLDLFLHSCRMGEDNIPIELIRESSWMQKLDELGFGCVHYLCQRGHVPSLIKLLALYPSNGLQDVNGENMLHHLVKGRYKNQIKTLLSNLPGEEATSLLRQKNNAGLTPLMSAIQNSAEYRIVKMLVDYGSEKNQVLPDGTTMLDWIKKNNRDDLLGLFQ